MFLSRILPHPRIALTAVVGLLLASCAGAPGGNGTPEQTGSTRTRSTASLRSGFACCNLRYSGDQLSSSNYAQLPFIAVGTPVLIRAVDDAQAIVEINGRRCCCGLIRPTLAKVRPSGLTRPSWHRIRGAGLRAYQGGCVRQSSRVAS